MKAIDRTNLESNPIRRIEAELGPGEVLLWTGSPILVFRLPYVKGSPHSSCLGALGQFAFVVFLSFATAAVLRIFLSEGWSGFIAFFGIFIIWLFVRMWIVNPIQRANRYYAITNRRAIVVARRGRQAPRSLSLESIASLAHRRDRTGVGSIDCFVPRHPEFDREDDESADHYPAPLFEYIADSDAALALLRRLSTNEQSS